MYNKISIVILLINEYITYGNTMLEMYIHSYK